MRDARRRPMGRLCYWVMMGIATVGLWVPGGWGQGGAPTTTVADNVYLADGTAAQGTMIVTWPAFQTASGAQVASGTKNVPVTKGAFSVGLVPNAGATPAGVYYVVVYQLGPGQVKTEDWVVPTTSPANLAAVRTTPGSGVAGSAVSMQYVNSALATKADDSSVMHLNGSETISGTKTFASAPNVPAPTSAGQVASKGYVDQALSNVGAGNYLPTAGGTMTGPITLPGAPAAGLQAANKQYVDNGLGSKADLISGLVPASELGTGQATANNCLLGNGTWGPCSAGGTGNLSTTPTGSQTIAQPPGTQFSTNNLGNIRYVTPSWNWAQTPADDLSTPGNSTIHLSPCPMGIDTTSSTNFYTYKVYISGKGTAEAVRVTGGNCPPGAANGTINVTTAYGHAAGYTVGSASSGIQEAWNDAWTSDIPTGASSATAPYVRLVADTNYNVYATIYLRGRGGVFDGAGSLLYCSTRDRCIYIGTTQNSPQVHHHKLYNLTGASGLFVDGVQVASVSGASGTLTVTTASTHPFVVGDTVDCEYHSQTADQHWVSPVTSVPSASTFTVQFGKSTFSAGANTFGFCNILNAFVENNSDHVVMQDTNIMQVSPGGYGAFSYGIVNDNDQQFVIERASNRSTGSIKNSANWPIGTFVYQRADQGNAGITYVHNSEFTNVNCIYGGGNGLVLTDSVCQGFPLFGVRYFGGLQPATFQNVYEESTGGTPNPLYGLAAQMGYSVRGGLATKFVGAFPTSGFEPAFAQGGGGAAERDYFVVPRSSTMGYGPLLYAGWAQPATGSTNVTVKWPSIELQDALYSASLGTLTWDVLVVTGFSGAAPYGTGNYAIATNISGSCTTSGMCSFVDTQAGPSSYTVQAQQFNPVFWFWPVNLVINNSTVYADVVGMDPQAVASQGTAGVSIVAEQCVPGGFASRRSPIWVSCLVSSGNGGSGYLATLLQQTDAAGNGPPVSSKGRINFGKTISTPNDLITFADSSFTKTLATLGGRPSNDAGDMAIGLDQTGGMAQRAGTSISSYINAVPSGTNFLERLTAAGKTFNVPVTVNGGFTVSGGNVTLPVTGTGSQCLHVSATGVVSGTGADCGSGGDDPPAVTVNLGSTSQVAMYSGNGAAVNGDSVLTDNGTTLNYAGAGGIAATSGTFSGNLTVNGQLQVAGPWAVSSPIPGVSMLSAGAGTSALGISNDGNFYISTNGGAPQKVATAATSSYFSNLWQEDPNTLGAYNGTNGQTMHVYGTYSNSSVYERTGLGWDANDNYFVVKNENAGTGTYQRGIGFWIGSGIRWAIDSGSAFKPFSNNSFDVGVVAPSQLVPRTVYAGTSFDTLTQGRLNFELCNDTGTGTALNLLAVYSAATPGCAVKAGTTSGDGVIGVVSNGSGTIGNAVITYRGYVQCSFDSGTTAGDYVVASTLTAGDCHDAGATRPTGVQVLGRVESTNAGPNTYGVRISLDAPAGGGGGGSTSSPTFTGTVTLPDGTTDSASGIALATAVTLPGGSTATTQPVADNSSKIATTGYVQAQKYLTNTGAFLDASLVSGSTLDVKLNNANALAITTGNATIDARALGGAQTIASEVSIGQLRPPVVTAVSGTSPGAGTYKVVYTLTSPTAAETSSSMEATVTVTGSQAIQVSSPAYYGTATSYSVYLTAAAGASWTERKCSGATGVAIGTAATVSAACSGAAVSLSNQGFGVTLIPPHTGSWNVSIDDSVPNTSCGLRFFDQSSYLGDGTGEGRPFQVTAASSATDVEALICTDNNAKTSSSYYRLEGLSAVDVAGDTIRTAVIAIQNAFDTSAFPYLHGGTHTAVPVLWAWNTCCSTSFMNPQLEANNVGTPLRIGNTTGVTNSTTFVATSAVHPGSGRPIIEFYGSGQSTHFTGTTYLEGGTACNADLIQTGTGTQAGGPIDFDSVKLGANCSGSNVYMYSLAVTNSIYHFHVGATAMGGLVNVLKYNPNPALNIGGLSSANQSYPEITLDNNNPVTVLTNFQVQGATALGTATATTPGSSDNSTNVATTAFVKGQGYAGLASPALTGSPTAPTASVRDNSTKLATTAYVDGAYTATWTPLGNAFSTTGVGFNTSTNHANLFGVFLRTPVYTCNVTVYINAADNSANTYDLGIYQGTAGSSDALLVHTGAVAGSSWATASATNVTLPWSGSTCAFLPPGRYYIGMYANIGSATMTLGEDSGSFDFYHLNGFSITPSSGGLPGSITGPNDGFVNSPAPFLVLH